MTRASQAHSGYFFSKTRRLSPSPKHHQLADVLNSPASDLFNLESLRRRGRRSISELNKRISFALVLQIRAVNVFHVARVRRDACGKRDSCRVNVAGHVLFRSAGQIIQIQIQTSHAR